MKRRNAGGSLNILEGAKCPRCGSGMFIKQACCGWRKRGWARVIRCVSPNCPYMEGYEKENGRC